MTKKNVCVNAFQSTIYQSTNHLFAWYDTRVMSWRAFRERMVRRLTPRPDVRFDIRIFYPPSSDFSVTHTPFEIAFGLSAHEEHMATIRSFIDRGYGIGIRSMTRTPDTVRLAVERIAETQGGVYEPWLSRLIFEGVVPVFTSNELLDAQDAGMNLYQDVRTIQESAPFMLRSILADVESRGVADEHLTDITRLNEALAPLSFAYLHHRIHADDAVSSLAWKARIVRAVMVIGPCALIVSQWSPGFGMVIAALGEQVWQGALQAIAWRRAGHTERQRLRMLTPYALLALPASWMAWQSAGLIASGSLFAAGVVFGIAAIAYPLLRLADEWAHLRSRLQSLGTAGKLPVETRMSISGLIAREQWLRPRQFASWIAVLILPIVLAFGVWILPPLFSYAWTFSFAPVIMDGLIACHLWMRRRMDRWWFQVAMRHRANRASRS